MGRCPGTPPLFSAELASLHLGDGGPPVQQDLRSYRICPETPFVTLIIGYRCFGMVVDKHRNANAEGGLGSFCDKRPAFFLFLCFSTTMSSASVPNLSVSRPTFQQQYNLYAYD